MRSCEEIHGRPLSHVVIRSIFDQSIIKSWGTDYSHDMLKVSAADNRTLTKSQLYTYSSSELQVNKKVFEQ